MVRLPPLLLPALIAVALTVVCHHDEHHHDDKPTLRVTTPVRRTVELPQEHVAQVRAIQHIEVRALEGGYLEGVSCRSPPSAASHR